jgi:hypothetical protein
MKKKYATVEFPSRFAGIGKAFRKIPWMIIWIMAGLVWGCTNQKQENTKEILIQVNDRKISVAEFNDKFDAMNDDMPSNVKMKPADQSEMRRYLLNQLIERLILMERAKELELQISDAELKKAVAEIKKDYPDEVFKQVLLEQNVSFRRWKEELRTRILLEKVVEKELEPLISLKPDDISAYYEKHYPSHKKEAGSVPTDETFNETLLQMVSNQKREEAYQVWIAELQKRYTIEVNAEAWKEINASSF